jgi:allophanate hydrolase
LLDLGATLVRRTRTSARYELYVLSGPPPKKPGLKRVEHGAKIDLEVWAMPAARLSDFIGKVNTPLGVGSVELDDGSWVKGFICEPWGLEGAEEITKFGGFRAYAEEQDK